MNTTLVFAGIVATASRDVAGEEGDVGGSSRPSVRSPTKPSRRAAAARPARSRYIADRHRRVVRGEHQADDPVDAARRRAHRPPARSTARRGAARARPRTARAPAPRAAAAIASRWASVRSCSGLSPPIAVVAAGEVGELLGARWPAAADVGVVAARSRRRAAACRTPSRARRPVPVMPSPLVTASTIAASTSGSDAGCTPWPRLKM